MHKIIKFLVKKYLFLSLAYLVLGIVFSFPLIQNINTKIPNRHISFNATELWGDHIQSLGHSKEHQNYIKQIFNGEPILNKEFCFEERIEDCTYSKPILFGKIVLSPFWMITLFSIFVSSITAYNLNIIFSFVFTGLIGFLLAKEFQTKTKNLELCVFKRKIIINTSDLIAFWASLFFTLANKRLIHLYAGQKVGFLILFFGLVVLLFEKYIKLINQKSNKKKLLIVALLFTIFIFTTFTEHFIIFYSILYISFRILWFELFQNNLKLNCIIKNISISVKKNFWIPILFLSALIFSFITKLGEISSSTINSGRLLGQIEYNSAPFFSLWSYKIFGFEKNIYIGFGLLLIVIGLYLGIYHLINKKKIHILLFFTFFSILMATIAIGTNSSLYVFFYNYIPTFKYSRTPGRAILMTLPILSILASYIGSRFWITFRKYLKIDYLRFLFLVGFISISIFGFHSKTKVNLVTPLELYQFVQSDSRILFLPYSSPEDPFGSMYEYIMSEGNNVSLNGYDPFPQPITTFFSNQYLSDLNTGQLGNAQINDLVTTYDIDYIVVIDEIFNNEDFSQEATYKEINDMLAKNSLLTPEEDNYENWTIYKTNNPST